MPGLTEQYLCLHEGGVQEPRGRAYMLVQYWLFFPGWNQIKMKIRKITSQRVSCQILNLFVSSWVLLMQRTVFAGFTDCNWKEESSRISTCRARVWRLRAVHATWWAHQETHLTNTLCVFSVIANNYGFGLWNKQNST